MHRAQNPPATAVCHRAVVPLAAVAIVVALVGCGAQDGDAAPGDQTSQTDVAAVDSGADSGVDSAQVTQDANAPDTGVATSDTSSSRTADTSSSTADTSSSTSDTSADTSDTSADTSDTSTGIADTSTDASDTSTATADATADDAAQTSGCVGTLTCAFYAAQGPTGCKSDPGCKEAGLACVPVNTAGKYNCVKQKKVADCTKGTSLGCLWDGKACTYADPCVKHKTLYDCTKVADVGQCKWLPWFCSGSATKHSCAEAPSKTACAQTPGCSWQP